MRFSRLSRHIPWRRLRLAVVVCSLVFLVHVIWKFLDVKANVHQWTQYDGEVDVMSEKRVHSLSSNDDKTAHRVTNVCKKIVPFKEISSGAISTFDLPDQTDYSVGKDRLYKIPQEFFDAADKPLTDEVKVFIVPFSHADPGYGNTFEGYYKSKIRQALNNMVEHLTQHSNMTFQWAETVFLERWFRDLTPDTKQKVRKLVSSGQFEIVLGGWVMPDEASTHFQTVIDQLIEGHQWVEENLGVKPKNAWINDPFGYSSTLPYLWKKSGVENMVILRIHQAIKGTLMKKRALDFKWRPYWNYGSDVNDILCNLMPYHGYWTVCGHDPEVCGQFNFLRLHNQYRGVVGITDENLATQAEKLYKQFRFTSHMFQYNTLVIFFGEDNSFDSMASFTDTNKHYGKVINYINSRKEWKMKVKFGTIAEYFENVRKNEASLKAANGQKHQFPILSGDFFPYSDEQNDVWTGYFTTRMWMKRFTREVESLIRAADVFSVLAYLPCMMSGTEGTCGDDVAAVAKDIIGDLRTARREVGMFQHHDGITGTSLSYVVSDYEKRLQNALASTKRAFTKALLVILTSNKVQNVNAINDNIDKVNAKDIMDSKMFYIGTGKQFIVVNTLEKSRRDIVNFYVDRGDIVITDESGNEPEVQISINAQGNLNKKYLVTVPVTLLPYEIATIHVKPGSQNTFNNKTQTSIEPNENTITIKNKYISVTFNATSGFLESIVDSEGRETKVKSGFHLYTPEGSGAYLFRPRGPASDILVHDTPTVKVENGPVFSEVRVFYGTGFLQTYTLYHIDGIKGRGLHVSNQINLAIANKFINKELVWRLKTDIISNDMFFVDQNGFQLLGRKAYRNRPIETNFYPMTTMAVIEDEQMRLTVHSAEAHGVASLEEGWLEIMLDRNVQNDDRKGLGTGASERVNTLTEFIIQIEHKVKAEPIAEPRFTFPSVESVLLNEYLQNKIQLFSVEQSVDQFQTSFVPAVLDFPCDIFVSRMRFIANNELQTNKVSVVLHAKPVHCSFAVGAENLCSASDSPITMQDFLEMFSVHPNTNRFSASLFQRSNANILNKIRESIHQKNSAEQMTIQVKETSLSHLHEYKSLGLDDDMRPTSGELRSFAILINQL